MQNRIFTYSMKVMVLDMKNGNLNVPKDLITIVGGVIRNRLYILVGCSIVGFANLVNRELVSLSNLSLDMSMKAS